MALSTNLVLSKSVRHLRKQQGWSQEELAYRCKLHRTYVGAIERGERNITLSTLDSIARALKTPASKLIDGSFHG